VPLLRAGHSRWYQRYMLAEGIVYLLSYRRTPPAFRRHLVDAIGLWARGRRQYRAWAPHLQRTRDVIEHAMDAVPGRRTVAVLGAGPLFDLPVETLAQKFGRVLLIDIAHLWPAQSRIARLRNVATIWRDLAPTGEAAPLAFLNSIPGLDWVISLNLVSQLAHTAREGAEATTVDQHLHGLDALPVPVTLVTDTSYRLLDRSGAELEQFDLLYGCRLPQTSDTWLWNVAPFGEEAPDSRRVHSVSAFPDWHAARR
jgi:hypothetical protein